MALNILKLCVGCSSPEELEAWIDFTLEDKKRRGAPAEQYHTTRMIPKRVEELTDGGSLYWVMKGGITCRQRLLDVRPFRDSEGVNRCHLVLDPVVVRTEWVTRRRFRAGAICRRKMSLLTSVHRARASCRTACAGNWPSWVCFKLT